MKPLHNSESVRRYLLMMFRWRLLGIAGLVLSLVTVAFFCDNAVDHLIPIHPDSAWKSLAVFFSRYGDWPFLILYAVLIFASAFAFTNNRLMSVALAMGVSCGICGTTATIIRSLTGRTRPSAHEPQGWYGAFHNSHWLIGNHDFNSFPSGHVGAVVGFAIPLLLGTRRGRYPAVALSLAVGWSRLFLRCHHLSDVVVAAIIGVGGGICVWFWISQKHLDFRRRSPAPPLLIAPKPLEQS